MFPTPAPEAMGPPTAMEVLLRRSGGVDTTNIVDTRQMSSGERFLVACFLGAAIWNAVAMFPMVFLTFKRLWTLYFWAMILSTLGILICSASQIISVATPQVNGMVDGVISCVGWVFMVTGQSVVLYSRLHLLAITPRVLRLVLWMIIVNGITIHITGTVLTVGTRLQPPTSVPFTEAYSVFERINITMFFTQETILSGLYLWKSRDLLGRYSKPKAVEEPGIRQYANPRAGTSLRVVKDILTQLIVVNILILFLDITILVLEVSDRHAHQCGFQRGSQPCTRLSMSLTAPTKCEITILNRLIDFANRSRNLNTEFHIVTDLQREWNSTLQRAFGTQTSAEIGTKNFVIPHNQRAGTKESSGSRISREKSLERHDHQHP
ncbi:integral membrane protein [Diaporthe helianthi]|uniref:Integral membrane protein n=1 Tax=Diaporthe helianthi TaxID=158607 RepID=A0A2P5HZM6_DIAHE|nr:integral membrane protein [Diaporthe helianthi]